MVRNQFVSAFILLGGLALLAEAPPQEAQAPMTPFQMEAAAVGGLRTISGAQEIYARQYPDEGFACSFAVLGPSANGLVSAEHAGLLDKAFVSGTLDGYVYELICPDPKKPVKKYLLSAVPQAPNEHRMRAFCVDEKAEIKTSLDGKAKSCFKNGKKI